MECPIDVEVLRNLFFGENRRNSWLALRSVPVGLLPVLQGVFAALLAWTIVSHDRLLPDFLEVPSALVCELLIGSPFAALFFLSARVLKILFPKLGYWRSLALWCTGMNLLLAGAFSPLLVLLTEVFTQGRREMATVPFLLLMVPLATGCSLWLESRLRLASKTSRPGW